MIADNIKEVKNKILELGSNAELVAVSKYKSEPEILEAINAGQKIFGENKVQEALHKWKNIKNTHPEIQLHLIGSLQTNKVKEALEIFDCIEVIDRPRLAREISRYEAGRKIPCLIQVNTGKESQKSGVVPEEVDSLLEFCKDLGLNIKGFMCIPPAQEDPAGHFQYLRELTSKYKLEICSMGMSQDYDIAARIGATHVRVGTAIFGNRTTYL